VKLLVLCNSRPGAAGYAMVSGPRKIIIGPTRPGMINPWQSCLQPFTPK
jgi:hypothetical protein